MSAYQLKDNSLSKEVMKKTNSSRNSSISSKVWIYHLSTILKHLRILSKYSPSRSKIFSSNTPRWSISPSTQRCDGMKTVKRFSINTNNLIA